MFFSPCITLNELLSSLFKILKENTLGHFMYHIVVSAVLTGMKATLLFSLGFFLSPSFSRLSPCVSPGSSHTFSFLLLSQVLISVAAATLRLPPTYSSSLNSLSSLLSVAELVNDCVLFIFFLFEGPHMSWLLTKPGFLSTVSSFHVFVAYLLALFLPFLFCCSLPLCFLVFLMALLAVSRAVNCGHSRTLGGPSLLSNGILECKLVCSMCLVWLFAFMLIKFKCSAKLLVHR